MANWLDRLLPPPSKSKKAGGTLPDVVRRNIYPLVLGSFSSGSQGKLPNASLIYGIGAAALLTFSLYFLFTGMWLTGVLLLMLAACLLGFALHYMRAME